MFLTKSDFVPSLHSISLVNSNFINYKMYNYSRWRYNIKLNPISFPAISLVI